MTVGTQDWGPLEIRIQRQQKGQRLPWTLDNNRTRATQGSVARSTDRDRTRDNIRTIETTHQDQELQQDEELQLEFGLYQYTTV